MNFFSINEGCEYLRNEKKFSEDQNSPLIQTLHRLQFTQFSLWVSGNPLIFTQLRAELCTIYSTEDLGIYENMSKFLWRLRYFRTATFFVTFLFSKHKKFFLFQEKYEGREKPVEFAWKIRGIL